MQKLIVVRGLPGAGKSSFAAALVKAGIADRHHEADMWMYNSDGEYAFDMRLLSACHGMCASMTEFDLADGASVVLSNTYIRGWELAGAVKLARKWAYR